MRNKGKLLALVMLLVMMLAVAMSASAADYSVTKPSNFVQDYNYPVIYVLPDNGLKGNSIASKLAAECMEAYIVEVNFAESDDIYAEMDAIVKAVDDNENYNTINEPKYRAIVGTEVGGYLAYKLAFLDSDGNALSAPKYFSFVASIDGAFKNDVYTKLNALGRNGTALFNQYYTYMDTPVDSEWANADGSTNALGSLFISRGIAANKHEYTARPGSMTSAFMNESISRIASRMSTWMLTDIVEGKAAPETTAISAKYKTADIDYRVDISGMISDFAAGSIPVKVTVEVVDSATGKTLSTKSATHKLSATNSFAEGSMDDMNIQMTGTYSTVKMYATILGAKTELSSTDLVYKYDPEFKGEYQTVDLMGDDWHFKYFGSQSARSLTTEEVMAQYEEWDTVLPALGNWIAGYGNITDPTGFRVNGDGYYVKTFTIPKEFTTTEPVLSIGYVDDRCEVWLNGKRLGATGINDDGTPRSDTTWAKLTYFELDRSDLNFNGTNTVIVRAFNGPSSGSGGWYKGPVGLYSMTAYNQKYGFGTNKYFYEESFDSEVLGYENDYVIYLPQDYYESDRYYPTMYLLHQLASDHTSYMTDKINEEMDEAIKAGLFEEMIVVIPNSSEMSFWTEKWGNMITQDLIPHIEQNYRAIPDARYRMTAGCSMGGQGCMDVALTNPEYFTGAASFFGAFSYAGWFGGTSPVNIANRESSEYLNYFDYAFICGNQDSYGFGTCNIQLHQALLNKDVPHYFFIENGGHDSAFYVPYFQQTIEQVRDNMYTMPTASADALIDVQINSVSRDSLSITFTADEAIKNYFLEIPESSYTPEGYVPSVTLPVVATLTLKNGEKVDVKFFITFDENTYETTYETTLEDYIAEDAVITDIKLTTQLLGRDQVADSSKVEELDPKTVDLPSTGDNSNIALFAALLLLSVAGIAILGKKKAAC